MFVQTGAFLSNPHQWRQKIPGMGPAVDICKTKGKRRNSLIDWIWFCTLKLLQFPCYKAIVNVQWEEKPKASEVFTIRTPRHVKQLLGAIHVQFPLCCTAINAKASEGKTLCFRSCRTGEGWGTSIISTSPKMVNQHWNLVFLQNDAC